MDIYLAGANWWSQLDSMGLLSSGTCQKMNVLESFYYKSDFPTDKVKYIKKYMLDSGAFTFFTQSKTVDWTDYVVNYATYVKNNNIELFFELDIDSLIGYDRVKELRRLLEIEAGRPCIPVWHKNRGQEDFLRMCEEYDYVAIGGIVSREIKRSEYNYFPWLIREAHKRKAKIHGLGFTNLTGLQTYHFDSVDSTSWLSGARFGHHYLFTGNNLVKIDRPPGVRLKTRPSVAHNLIEWIKFCEYAETHL